jgi:hypothetical protein
MSKPSDILSTGQLRQHYGRFYEDNPRLQLERRNIPQTLWPLLAYAEFWGVADDLTREQLVEHAPAEVRHNLKQAVASLNGDLDKWLAGPEADDPHPTDEYVAYSAMRIAADYA